MQTLDSFLENTIISGKCGNAYVTEQGWESLYIRVTQRYINGCIVKPVIDLAKIEASEPGGGAFTKLVKKLRVKYPEAWIYVESVLNKRFEGKLVNLGFKQQNYGDLSVNFYLSPDMDFS